MNASAQDAPDVYIVAIEKREPFRCGVWKITDEDWRNREKWPQYEVAVDEMLQKTSTKYAPWYIIESNDKKYARIRTLKIVVSALEKACENRFEQMMD